MEAPSASAAVARVVMDAPAQEGAAHDAADIGALWAKAQRAGGEVGPLLRAVMANSTLVSLQGGGDGPRRAVVSIAPSWSHRAAKWTEQIGELLGKLVGGKVIVEWAGGEVASEGSGGDEPGSGRSAVEPGGRVTAGDHAVARSEPVQVTDHPLVQRAIELFGGRVVDVQPRRK